MKKLAIIGASYLQLPLVEKAIEMGIETHCFAWADGAICKDVANYFYPVSVLDKESILQECQKIGIDGITTIATDIAMPTISYVAEHLGLTANTQIAAINATDKWRMREAFARHGCSIPKYEVVDSASQTVMINFPVIVKPVDRSGSQGVTKVINANGLKPAVEKALLLSISKKAIVEEYIDGDEVSVESITWKGRHYILAITDKVTTGSPNFVELAHHQPSNLLPAVKQRIIKEATDALTALDIMYGAGHTEIKITPDGRPYVIEVGARMGGDFIGSHLVEISTGYDFLRGVINIALGHFEIPEINEEKYSGVYFLCKETEKLLPLFKKPQEFEHQKEMLNADLKNATNSNDRSGYFIYTSVKREMLL